MDKTLNEITHDWMEVRDGFAKRYGAKCNETDTYIIQQDNPKRTYFMNLGIELYVQPTLIAEANLRVLGRARKELVGYTYDRNFRVPCNRLLDGAVIEIYKNIPQGAEQVARLFEGMPINFVDN